MTPTDLYSSIVRRIADLGEDSLLLLSQYISFLKWQEEQWREWPEDAPPTDEPADAQGPPAAASRPPAHARWVYDFIEHIREATVTATKSPAGMEVRVGAAMCGLEQRLAIWQHPPVAGASVVQYQLTVPPDAGRLRLRTKIGIRNGSLIGETPDNYVAFRFYVNGVRLWSATKNTTTWEDVTVELPSVAGEFITVQFVTDGLGDSRWNWAVWGTPLLIGE
ncbi:MAG: hypothetical protein NZ528_11985 [Caldilineales bacterium]|nr:hypothetical protein [Caldilineales bacterium]MDW8318544.1 hypothetical protein [Anaerolineae bacterium]